MAIPKNVIELGPAYIATLTDAQCEAIMRRAEAVDFGPFVELYTEKQNEIAYFYIGIIMERLGYERQD